jgi:hypothetical protein
MVVGPGPGPGPGPAPEDRRPVRWAGSVAGRAVARAGWLVAGEWRWLVAGEWRWLVAGEWRWLVAGEWRWLVAGEWRWLVAGERRTVVGVPPPPERAGPAGRIAGPGAAGPGPHDLPNPPARYADDPPAAGRGSRPGARHGGRNPTVGRVLGRAGCAAVRSPAAATAPVGRCHQGAGQLGPGVGRPRGRAGRRRRRPSGRARPGGRVGRRGARRCAGQPSHRPAASAAVVRRCPPVRDAGGRHRSGARAVDRLAPGATRTSCPTA